MNIEEIQLVQNFSSMRMKRYGMTFNQKNTDIDQKPEKKGKVSQEGKVKGGGIYP